MSTAVQEEIHRFVNTSGRNCGGPRLKANKERFERIDLCATSKQTSEEDNVVGRR